jgi:hypothetical protein
MSENVTHAVILKAIEEMEKRMSADIAELKAENSKLWNEVTNLTKQVAAGGGAVKALMWVGATVLTILGIVAAFWNLIKT